MNMFYQSLVSKSASPKPYLKALVKLTKASHEQMNALASDLAWQQWGEAETA